MTTGSPVGGAGLGAPEDAGLSGVRERLIEAAAGALEACDVEAAESHGGFATDRDLARAALAAVLPLIADEIERAEVEPYRRAAAEALRVARVRYELPDKLQGAADAAALVRSWAADGAR